MSCNGCRVLRKGCSDTCILRSCLQWIESPEAQGNATVFVAKFFGRAGLMGFISAVPESQRPALFQSLLYEACGRTVNPVYGAVGLLWIGNWHLCQAAVETVLKGGTLRPAASLPANSKSMQFLPGRPQTSLQRSTTPEIAAINQPVSVSFYPSARCSEALRRPKRSSSEFDSGTGERSVASCSLQGLQRLKTCRTSEQEVKEVRPDREDVHPQQIPALMLQPAPRASKSEVSSQPAVNREPAQPAGQLVAPVARRVRPKVDEDTMKTCFRSVRGQTPQEETLAESPENIELDLTLNSHAMSSSERMKVGSTRVSSPSTISVNSEGSVTSLDSVDFSMARWPARTPSPREERNLLRLLL